MLSEGLLKGEHMQRFICSFFVFAALTGVVFSDDVASSAGEELQGEWLLTSVDIQGKTLPAPAEKGGSIVFAKEGKLTLKDPGKPDKTGSYKVDAATSPMQLDLIVAKKGKESETMQGIYELDGDNLKMCFSADGAKGKRPREFKGEKVLIMHFKRQK